MATSPVTYNYTLFKNDTINISTGSSDAISTTVDPHIPPTPGSGWQLQSAILKISASQNNNGGAHVYPWLNGTNLGSLDWGALDNSVMTKSFDITSDIQPGGTNEFYIEYRIDIVAFLLGSAADVQFTTLEVTWVCISGNCGPPPPPPGEITLTEILIGIAVALVVAIGVVVVRRKGLPK